MDDMDGVDGAVADAADAVDPVATRRKDIVQVRYVGPGFLLGVPARDLSADEWVALTDGQRNAALHSKVFEIMKEGE